MAGPALTWGSATTTGFGPGAWVPRSSHQFPSRKGWDPWSCRQFPCPPELCSGVVGVDCPTPSKAPPPPQAPESAISHHSQSHRCQPKQPPLPAMPESPFKFAFHRLRGPQYLGCTRSLIISSVRRDAMHHLRCCHCSTGCHTLLRTNNPATQPSTCDAHS